MVFWAAKGSNKLSFVAILPQYTPTLPIQRVPIKSMVLIWSVFQTALLPAFSNKACPEPSALAKGALYFFGPDPVWAVLILIAGKVDAP